MNKFITFCCMIALSACSNYLAEDEELKPVKPDGKEIPMSLQVRSSSEDAINYPIQTYIFDRSGKEVRHNEIPSSQQSLEVTLPAGEYVLATLAGVSTKEYQIPEKPNLTSTILTEGGKPCPTAIQYGRNTVNLQKEENIDIRIAYIVSCLDFKILEVPEDATSVEIGVSPTSRGFKMDGSFTNDNYICRTSCKHVGKEWTAGPIYVLPSSNGKTTLTLYVNRPAGKESLSYTYSSALKPAQPYCFSGKYKDGISLKGSFQVDGWQPGIDVNFDFTEPGKNMQPDEPSENGGGGNEPGGNDDPGNDNQPADHSSSVIYCNTLPQAGDFYQDFYVWKAENVSSTETRALILSKNQWFDILAVKGPGLINKYDGLGLSGWRVFTRDEAKEFNADLTQTITTLNEQLQQHNQEILFHEDKERYLCDDCKATFSVNGSNRITAAGSKQTYYMRGLKNVTFKTY